MVFHFFCFQHKDGIKYSELSPISFFTSIPPLARQETLACPQKYRFNLKNNIKQYTSVAFPGGRTEGGLIGRENKKEPQNEKKWQKWASRGLTKLFWKKVHVKGWENVQDIARVPKSKSRDKHIQEIKVRAKSCRYSGKKIFHLYDGQCRWNMLFLISQP